jgi:hypothetical protein
MSFAITVSNLIDAMQEPGCPICRLERKAARKYVEVFLWENLMDHSLRDQALGAYGFCPPHTRFFAGIEQSSSGPPLAINILYETLNQRVSRELSQMSGQSAPASLFQRLLTRLKVEFHIPLGPRVLRPTGPCPICESAAQSGLNTLSALFEEIERGTADVLAFYQQSDGICLAHLRLGLDHYSYAHPKAARFLSNWAAERLERWSGEMKEFIRKKNWEYRAETLTPDEAAAWQHTLTFYTGYPTDSFTPGPDEG